ncbi:hypothetical protein Celaphus_00000353 [Cervus elaphus hippelaphus]|uniref:Uncharacterized protein n=1 Tax=Cervus elaphus hippelaphus TaxID=46360 RepID=A0A212DB47_CEREH|nr:hypothetical protein Celaphus_00000353 [Cervus elaphus hippelaphus]
MVSSPHREHPPKKGYDFDTVNKQTCQTYSFGKTSSCHLSIDASLTKLFECMTLAYRPCFALGSYFCCQLALSPAPVLLCFKAPAYGGFCSCLTGARQWPEFGTQTCSELPVNHQCSVPIVYLN